MEGLIANLVAAWEQGVWSRVFVIWVSLSWAAIIVALVWTGVARFFRPPGRSGRRDAARARRN